MSIIRRMAEMGIQYTPIPPPSARRPASASASASNVLSAALSKVVRRGPADEDEELASAKGALEKLEGTWGNTAANVNALGKARRGQISDSLPYVNPADLHVTAHAMALTEVGAKMVSLSTVESDIQLGSAVRKMGRAYEQLANLSGSQVRYP